MPAPRLLSIISLIFICFSTTAQATADEIPTEPKASQFGTEVFINDNAPNLRINTVGGSPDLFGVSVGLTRFNPFEIEAGFGILSFNLTTLAQVGGITAIRNLRRSEGLGWASR